MSDQNTLDNQIDSPNQTFYKDFHVGKDKDNLVYDLELSSERYTQDTVDSTSDSLDSTLDENNTPTTDNKEYGTGNVVHGTKNTIVSLTKDLVSVYHYDCTVETLNTNRNISTTNTYTGTLFTNYYSTRTYISRVEKSLSTSISTFNVNNLVHNSQVADG